jgi:mRNA interferase MazF
VVKRPLRGDCFWADLDPTEGHEQAGRRPVLVLSENRYNERSGMIVMVPLTTRNKFSPPLSLDLGLVAGTRAYALPAQARALSNTRLGKQIDQGRHEEVERCLDALLQICGRAVRARGQNDERGG